MLPPVSQFMPLPSVPTATPLKPDARFPASANNDRLASAVKDFEATFLGLLLKEMRQTLDADGGGLFAGDTGDVQGGLFDLYLGKHLADAGGVGFASSLARSMRYTTNARHPLPSTAGAGAAGAASA